jgi:hypothetical protein
MASSSSDELLQAEAQLWCHTFGYLKSTALQCAIKFGIPNAIDRCGGASSLSELHAALPVTASKRACLSRLMRFLAASGIFREQAAAGKEAAAAGAGSCYSLTPVSRLLVIPDGGNDDDRNGHTCLSQLILFTNSPFHLKSSQCLAEWLQKEEEEDGAIKAETPLAMAQGGSLYSVAGTDVEYGRFINEAMASDSRFVAEIVVHECREVFTGVTSLMDVGGGDGTMAAAIAKAFPQIRCSVLELPHVVDAAPADCGVQFIAGDMMEFIPPADVLLLKV